MTKSLLVFALLGIFATAAQAQSTATIWGNIDAGFMSSSSAGTRITGFQEGQIYPSEFGFKGTEDIGAGLDAGFVLAGGFNSGNGKSANEAGGTLFGREAEVTVGGNWGKVGVGLQYDPGFWAAIPTDPRGTDSLSNLEYWILATVGNTPQAFTGGIFDADAVSYTYSANGLYFGVLHSFGGVSGSVDASSGNSIGASYTNSGFTVSGSYATNNNALGDTSSIIDAFGLGYAIAQFAVRFQYSEFQSGYVNGTATSNVHSAGIGFDWKFAVANKLNLSFYDAKDAGARFGGISTEIALLDTFSLSKHTSIYGQLASVNVGANSGLSGDIAGIYTNAVVPSSGRVKIFGVGLRVSF